MGRRALVGTVAMLGVVALVGLFTALSFLFSSPDLVYAQTNDAPAFLDDNDADITETTRSVDENTAAYTNIGDPVTATDSDTDDRLTYSIKNARTSPFTIVRATGQLQVGQPLDHETKSSYEVVVQVTDSEDADGNFEIPAVVDDTITVTITVNNVEEAESVSLSWKQPQVRTPITASLTDLDGINSGPTWQWAEANTKTGNYTDLTGNGATSATYTPQPGDSGKYLRATATYTDGEDASKTAQAVSYRAVRDAPLVNAAPAFRDVPTGPGGYSCSPYQVDAVCRYIPQNTPVGGDIYYPVKATDSDHDEIRYSVGGTDADLFRIDRSGGTLFTTEAHAFNETRSYSITITATDPSGEFDSIEITLTPSGGTHNPVVSGPEDIVYPENGTWQVAEYLATTADQEEGYTHGWLVSVNPGGGDGDFFRLDDDGRLTFIQPPDFENPADEGADNTYEFSIEIYHTNTPPGKSRGHTVGINVTVTVVDVPNEALEIDGPSAVRYAEHGTGPVANYSVADVTETVQWVLSGADGNEFNIGADGALTFNESPDYENPTDTDAKNDYLLTITVYTLTDAKTEFIRVQVTDINEKPTFNDDLETTLNVEPDIGPNQQVGDPYTATDPDKGAYLTYSLSTNTLPFSIDPPNGQLSTVDPLPQFDRTSYTVTVLVTDNANDEGNFDTTADDQITITINIGDGGGSNNAPVFPAAAVTYSIDENTTTEENVGTPVVATDEDTDDIPTYTLGGTDGGFFTIVDTSGQIQTKTGQTYDFESKPSYSVTVTADDGNSGTATKAVTITLTNVEEAGTVRLSPTQPAARQAATATLTDPDEVSGTPTWQWQRSSDGSTDWSNVGNNSDTYMPVDGDLTYYLRATASYTDGEASGKTAHAVSASAVQTGTNRAPTFDDGQTTSRDVAEDAAATANVGAVVGSTDQDNDSLTYSLTSTDASSFTVDNTGQIKVGATTTLDYESAKNTYTVVVQVTDSKDPAGDTETNPTNDDIITVTINVTNVNEDGTVNLSMTQPSVRTEITATLTDPDGGVTSESWQWAKADAQDGNYSDINGEISANYTPDDGDVSKFLKAKVSYTDAEASGKNAEAVSDNAVQAGTNRAPTFASGAVTLTVPENSTANVDVGSPVTATDLDTGNTVTHSLEGTDKDSFGIVSGTGQIQTKSGVTYDYETKASYSVTVKADDGNSGTATKAVTITLTNVEEAGTVRLSPTQPAARQAATATLTDPDEVSGTPTWQWQRSSDGSTDWSNVGNNSDTYMPVDGDLTYYLRATASYTDGEASGKTAHAVSASAVQTGTNRAPTFDDGQTTSRDVAEDAAATANVGAVVGSTDQDNDSLTYSLTSTDASSFTVDNTGQIKVGATTTLDYESAKNTYTVVVQVTDSKDPAGDTETNPTNDDIITVTINVTNVNEDGTVSLSMTHPSARTQLTATLTDPDGGVTSESWQWAKADAQAGTYTDISGATLATYTPADGDVGEFLKATASYTDDHGQNKRAEAASDNAVQAGANRPPTFASSAVTFTVPENSAANVNVGSAVTATDLDTGNTLEYSLDATGATFFDIDSTSSGQIKTKSGVTYDHETTPSYSVTVTADDSKGGTDTIAVTIDVTDMEEDGTVTLSTYQPTARAQVTATLTDPDGVTGTTTWLWAKSSDGNTDWANVGTNSPSYTTVDGDVGSYLRATASYTDGHGPSKSANAQTTQKVGAGTNRAPEFGATTDTREVAEKTAAGQPVGAAVTANDPDNGDTLTYSMSGGDAGLFDFDTGTGQIKVKAGTTLDYEGTRKSYTVAIEVTDGKDADGASNPAMDDSIAVTINVTDVDEAGTVALSMTQPSVRTQLTATLTDPDGSVTSETWQWAKADAQDGNYSDITDATSNTYTPVDGDVGSYLRATASYTDAETSGKTAEAVSENAVQDGANRPPTFSASNVTGEVSENSGADVNVGSPVVATDLDTGNTLAYSLEGTDKDSFKIVSTSGQIQTKQGETYDYETKPTYSVTVKVDDGNSGTDTIAVTITVTDVEEAGTVALSTTQPLARTQLTATLTDPDGGVTLGTTWQWASSNAQSGAYTNITGATSNTYTPADGDVGNYLRATASYTDRRGPNKTAAAVSANAVQAGTNRQPTFNDDLTTTREVAENTEAGENAGDLVEATDLDNDSLTYSLTGTDATSFTVDSTGQIKVGTSTTLDHEAAKNSYTLIVQVRDSKDAGGTADTATDDTIVVTITVTDVNEPPLKPGTPTVSRTSNSAVSVTWTAPDNTGRPPILHYQYQYKKSAESLGSGEVFTTNGPILSVTIGTLDPGTSYDVEVRAINDEGPGPWSDTGTGSTNSPPDFSSATPAREVAENTVVVTSVGAPVTASDADSDDLAYTLEGPDANSFQIVSISGQIETKSGVTYDHEAKPSYTVTVKADDSNGGTDTIDVTITVTDVNEAPDFDGPTTTREVPENTVADTGIGGPVEAEDPDDGDSLTYSLGGTDASSFDIDTLTGQLKTKDALDHETKASYAVTVSVRDSKDANGDADTATDDTIDVTITVTDVNDPPEFPSTGANARSIAENTATNTNIGSPVRATDADNDNLTYTLEGTDDGSFAIDESSGQLKTKSALDYETQDGYTVTVKASDGKDGVDTIDVTITVTDVNEAPDFGSPTATRTVLENTQAGQPVGEPVSAKDQDAVDSLAYSLGGTDSASFGISSSTGQITVGTGTTLDFETTTRYEVTVTATDSSNLSNTITVTIKVSEGNDPPVFATDTATRNVAENTGTGQNIGATFKATDAEGETLTYTLEGTDAASFDIVSTSGQLQTKAALDYEVKSSYSVTVKAADSSASGTINVTVTVTDVNEPPLAPGQPGVSGDSASSVSVTWTAPANADRPAIAGYDYQYKKTNEQSWSGATYATDGVVTSATISGLDASTSYDVQVRAKNDEGTGPWSATGAGSTGNTDPAFSNSATTRDVAENTPADVNIGDPVTATDDDNGDSLTYTLGGVDAAAFDIDAKTGQLKTKAALDHEAPKNTYTVTVTATDSAGVTASATVTITVTNVNEPPSFGLDATDRTVAENTLPGDPVGLPVSAEDDDVGDTLTYSMAGADSASFGIDSGTGLITVGAGTRLDFESGTRTTYEVTVTATDSSHLSTTITVTIEVLNVDEKGVVILEHLQPQVDTADRASLDDPDGMVSGLTWKWDISNDGSSGWTAIAGGTTASYTPASGDVGKFLRVTASYSDGEGVNKTAQAAARPTRCRMCRRPTRHLYSPRNFPP